MKTFALLAICASVMAPGVALAAAAYNCNEITKTTEETFEKVVSTGRREIGRPADEGGAMERPKDSKDASCELENWIAMAVTSMVTSYSFGGAQMSGPISQGIMAKFMGNGCDKIEKEMKRSAKRFGDGTVPARTKEFPYEWGK